MNIKKFLPPEEEPKNAAYHFKNTIMEPVENLDLFNNFILRIYF